MKGTFVASKRLASEKREVDGVGMDGALPTLEQAALERAGRFEIGDAEWQMKSRTHP